MSPEDTLAHPFAPKIVKKLPQTIVSQDKQMVKMEVKVVGHPKPEVKWFKQGEEIVPSDEFQIENTEDGTSILVINEIYPDDTGEIKFEAYNSVGVAETVTQFFVEGKKETSSLEQLFFLFLNLRDSFSVSNKNRFAANTFPSYTHSLNLSLLFIYCCPVI